MNRTDGIPAGWGCGIKPASRPPKPKSAPRLKLNQDVFNTWADAQGGSVTSDLARARFGFTRLVAYIHLDNWKAKT